MKVGLLNRTHPDFRPDTLQKYSDLFKGGDQFRDRIENYLPQHKPVEPLEAYKARCASAYYLNHCASIANYFASWLFSTALVINSEPSDIDDFYGQFKEDCDARGTDFGPFLRARFLDALVYRIAHFRVKFPHKPEGETASDRAEWDKWGMGRAMLLPLEYGAIRNWRRDSQGEYMWCLEYSAHRHLVDFLDASEVVKETWTLWRREGGHQRWEIERPIDKPLKDGDDVPEVDGPDNTVQGVPIIRMELPEELWLMRHLADPQLELFRKQNAVSWAVDRTCYAMPILNLKTAKSRPTLGTGYFMTLGIDEKFTWAAPPSAPFDTVSAMNSTLKDELYRVAQQMARGIDNNAAAVGRSGASKNADDRATEVVLRAYGEIVREAAERAMKVISIGRAEEITWHATGMDKYHVTDAASITEVAVASDPLKIPSATYKRELFKQIVVSQLPSLEAGKKDIIMKEIDAGVTDEDVSMTMPMMPPGFGLQPLQKPALPPAPTDKAPALPTDKPAAIP